MARQALIVFADSIKQQYKTLRCVLTILYNMLYLSTMP